MEESTGNPGELTASAKQLTRRLATIGENRMELLMVELQQERERILHATFLVLGIAVFGLLAAMTLTAGIVVLFWAWSPLAVLLILTILYAGAATGLYWRLTKLLSDWQTLSATLDQLRKDRECLEKILA